MMKPNNTISTFLFLLIFSLFGANCTPSAGADPNGNSTTQTSDNTAQSSETSSASSLDGTWSLRLVIDEVSCNDDETTFDDDDIDVSITVTDSDCEHSYESNDEGYTLVGSCSADDSVITWSYDAIGPSEENADCFLNATIEGEVEIAGDQATGSFERSFVADSNCSDEEITRYDCEVVGTISGEITTS